MMQIGTDFACPVSSLKSHSCLSSKLQTVHKSRRSHLLLTQMGTPLVALGFHVRCSHMQILMMALFAVV